MHDGARQYEADTVVIDIEESSAPVRNRVATAELTMQVMVLGEWHRRTPDLKTTACGVPYHSQFAPTRREELCNPLCGSCFTHHELAIANVRDVEEGDR